jgi:hypothetical protein
MAAHRAAQFNSLGKLARWWNHRRARRDPANEAAPTRHDKKGNAIGT